MQVYDLDGNSSLWSFRGNIANGSVAHKSSYHIRARSLIHHMMPTMQILEEVKIAPRRSQIMYLDFYIPLTKICIEVHGEQHYKFVAHYHSSQLAFLQAQKRDREKQEWCQINNITYISLPYNETDAEWEQRILQ